MEQVASAVKPDDIVFVMDSTIGQAASAQAHAFTSSVKVGSVVITKLDGHAKGGGALSAVAATGAPIVFIGTGEHFDELQAFDPRSFVGKLLGRGDVQGLMTELHEKGIAADSEALMKRMEGSGGKYTFRDLYDQMASLLKLGPISKVMEAFPGMGQLMSASLQENTPPGQDPNMRFKRMMYVIDSMNDAEKDCNVIIDHSRIMRIAKGSGIPPQEVAGVIGMHKQFEKTVGGMAKAGLLKGSDAQVADKIRRNPNAIMQQLSKSVDPRMLKNMGGPGALMDMMKQFGGAGDMAKKMKDAMKGLGF